MMRLEVVSCYPWILNVVKEKPDRKKNKTNSQKKRNISTKFLIECGAQRLLKSCSFTENIIERKVKWIEEIFHTSFIYNLSLQVLLSNQIGLFIDQLQI